MRTIKLIGKNEAGEIRLQSEVPAFCNRSGEDMTSEVVSILCRGGMPTLLDKETQNNFRGNDLLVPVGYFHNIHRVWNELSAIYESDAYKTSGKIDAGNVIKQIQEARPHAWLKLPAIIARAFSNE